MMSEFILHTGAIYYPISWKMGRLWVKKMVPKPKCNHSLASAPRTPSPSPSPLQPKAKSWVLSGRKLPALIPSSIFTPHLSQDRVSLCISGENMLVMSHCLQPRWEGGGRGGEEWEGAGEETPPHLRSRWRGVQTADIKANSSHLTLRGLYLYAPSPHGLNAVLRDTEPTEPDPQEVLRKHLLTKQVGCAAPLQPTVKVRKPCAASGRKCMCLPPAQGRSCVTQEHGEGRPVHWTHCQLDEYTLNFPPLYEKLIHSYSTSISGSIRQKRR